jgi:hypothetical protein
MTKSFTFSVLLALMSYIAPTSAFMAVSNNRLLSVTRLQMAQTAAERLRKAREAAGVKENDEEQIFSDDLLLDFQQALLSLEKRVKEGPGSLRSDEVAVLEGRLNNIINEMNEYMANGGETKESKKGGPSAISSAAATATVSPSAPTVAQEEAPAIANWRYEEFDQTDDTNNESDDGPAFDGKGGWGLARGTTNTYYIPNMDEMSPEEYREALQKTVIEAQRARRAKGMVGNLSSSGYLDNL